MKTWNLSTAAAELHGGVYDGNLMAFLNSLSHKQLFELARAFQKLTGAPQSVRGQVKKRSV